MNEQSIEIQCGLRRLRGGSQAYLVRGTDHCFYAAKFVNNTNGPQSLINEWIACRILEQLRVCTPSIRVLALTAAVQQREQFHFVQGSRKIAVDGELHLGSPLPCDPGKQTIWDFLPRTFLPRVTNLQDFATTFVFDLWSQKRTRRQAVFVRSGEPSSFRAFMVDHSSAFTCPENGALSTPGRYFDEALYTLLPMERLCQLAAAAIERLPDLHVYADGIPPAWLTAVTAHTLSNTFRYFEQRKTILRDEISKSLGTRTKPLARRTPEA